MQLTPRYDDAPVLRLAGEHPDPADVLVQQRRRLADRLDGLSADQWAAPSRCDAWAVRDVVAHLVDVDRFWTFSIGAGRAGEPSRFLATFDPVTSPPQLVAAHADTPDAELLAAYRDGIDGLARSLDGLDAGGWDTLAEAPPGHIPLRALALHALWDGWVHERDIVLPLGLDPVEDDDEVRAALLYAAALGPAFMACGGSERAGTLVVEAQAPAARVVVDVGPVVTASLDGEVPADAVVLRGPAVELVEGLSLRAPLPCSVDDDDRWLLGTLDVVFEQA
ncbi:maleylpyruvate isomerase family protein [Iamia sp. SCSIO 61187]|uniref:maleylpyruvate isomerase N-terminal domain-containing protein n=1 Tax=Iamia sp. SCSIO 61187 TaxID=2722752 RepID=UPI001C635CBE|nr:maleylpyruvate isomerase N-terminal domain-containing protein [Iamia sp. SCSIO 61187]QYG91525.1 maleylpyruvate isomerase family protein [Iamia sp. SCSIO 61187]